MTTVRSADVEARSDAAAPKSIRWGFVAAAIAGIVVVVGLLIAGVAWVNASTVSRS